MPSSRSRRAGGGAGGRQMARGWERVRGGTGARRMRRRGRALEPRPVGATVHSVILVRSDRRMVAVASAPARRNTVGITCGASIERDCRKEEWKALCCAPRSRNVVGVRLFIGRRGDGNYDSLPIEFPDASLRGSGSPPVTPDDRDVRDFAILRRSRIVHAAMRGLFVTCDSEYGGGRFSFRTKNPPGNPPAFPARGGTWDGEALHPPTSHGL